MKTNTKVTSANLVPILILRVLDQHSSEENRLGQDDIRKYILDEYGYEISDRKTVPTIISRLTGELGIKIEKDERARYYTEKSLVKMLKNADKVEKKEKKEKKGKKK